MKFTKSFLCFLLVLSPLVASGAFTISVSPSSIAWDSNTWVSARITNDAAQGYAANMTVFVDPEHDGVVGPEDMPLMNFILRDGRTNGFGAVTFPDDDDGTTNGAILTRIPFFGLDTALHVIGNYIWQVAFTNGTSPAVTPFTVTQPTTTVYITGTVVNYTNPSIPIAAAFVGIYPFTRAAGFLPSAWTDTNGAFRIYLPPTMTGNVDGIMAGALGYFCVPNNEETGEWISGYRFTNDLMIGENALTNDLKVFPAVPGFLHTVSGQVVDEGGNPIPYAFVGFEERSDDGGDANANAVADINGDFELPIPDGMTGGVGADGGLLNLRGFVASGVDLGTVTQDLSGLVITCPAATILARNRAIDTTSGEGVEGVAVEFEADGFWNSAYSVTGGLYEIGLVSNTYKAGADSDFLTCMGYSGASGYEGLDITNAGIYTDAPFYLTRGYVVSGTVLGRNTNALTGGEVQLTPFAGGDGNGCNVNRQGYYLTLAATGTYRASARDFDGYIEQVYSNHFSWEWDEGPVADPITVTTNGATNINFFLSQASYIRGTVYGTNAPLANANVSANVGEEGRGGTRTDENGEYELAVLAGTDYTVRAQGPDGTFFLHQYWSNKTDDSEADLVTTDTNAPAENINFNLQLGGRVEGTLYEPDGSTPLTHTWGFVEARTTNDMSDFVAGSDIDQDNGTYSFAVPAGIYHMRAEADGWPDQYYDGVYESQQDQATPVTVEVSQVTSGIDFTMIQPSYVEGNVHSGATPLENVQVEVRVLADTNNPWQTDYVNQENSDASGDYSVPVPPGTNYVVVAYPEGDSYYVEQWWSNAPNSSQASLFDVGEAETVSNVHFDLLIGMRIEGQVWNELGDPMESVQIDSHRFDTNGSWIRGGGGETDGGGNYGFAVPAGTSYFVRAFRPGFVSVEDWWYPETFFSNKFDEASADQVQASPSATVSHVDFHLALGYRVEGFVYNSDGFSPAPNGYVYSENQGPTRQRYGGGQCEGDGSYRVCLPNHLPLILCGTAQDRVPEYHDNIYSAEQATAIQPAALTTTRVDFALYAYDEDSDSDGLHDYQEDSRPDGVYKDTEDWASYTNSDTEGDKVDDQAEWNRSTSPKLADTDGDEFTDYQEIYVTGTDPTATSQGSNSYLNCLQTIRIGSNVVLRWSAIEFVNNYYVQRSTNLMSGLYWSDLEGPITATGDVMTVTDSNAPPNSAYRVRIPYTVP